MIPHSAELNRTAEGVTALFLERWDRKRRRIGLCLALAILFIAFLLGWRDSPLPPVLNPADYGPTCPGDWAKADAIVAVVPPIALPESSPVIIPLFYQLQICLQTGSVRAVELPAKDVLEQVPLRQK